MTPQSFTLYGASRLTTWTVALVLLPWCAAASAAEIRGTVRSASKDTATIAIEGELTPNRDDPVEIYFKLPGAEEEISVATGKVTAVNPDSVEAKIDHATGTLSKDQLARITSEKPQQRTAAAAFSSPSAVATAAQSPAAVEQKGLAADGRNPSFAFVDMNKVFKDYPKTKDAEARINEKKNAAKEEYDKRAEAYKKLLDEINDVNRQLDRAGGEKAKQLASDRDAKIARIKEMEREINEFRVTREKELQDDAKKMREEIVSEINAEIKRLGGDINAILDVSGNSLNGIPLTVQYSTADDSTASVSAALNRKKAAPLKATHNLKLALVDMNSVFKRLSKTKDSEAKINSAKDSARKEYDVRADAYKKLLDEVNDLGRQIDGRGSGKAARDLASDRDAKIQNVKAMEREINEFRQAREKELQLQGQRLREEIVADITRAIKADVVKDDSCIVFDVSGMSLNGVPVILHTQSVPDLSDAVRAAAEKEGESQTNPVSAPNLVSTTELRFGCVDMNRAFKATPETQQAEKELNDQRANARVELANKTQAERDAKEKDLQEAARKKREPIVNQITEKVRQLANAEGFNVIFDSSGNSLNGVPLLISTHNLPDLTDKLIEDLKKSK